ncbi:MAG: hypothetical protein P8164_10175 [Gammaproteobacteria bacterium]|jgi:hypothetical protein
MSNPNIAEATALMESFAERTGLSGDHPPHRYLWTDAFAVCNFLGLAQATGEQRYTELALRLVDQVHHTLGRHRNDDPRSGWLSGLNDQDGEHHPTRGGLRIGKALPERKPDEPYDELLEWERDGQYFHYLTKWMHALDQVAQATSEPRYNLWARELARTAHHAFTFLLAPGGPRRMNWKMSVDLSRSLIPTMGQHDPLDGYITCLDLQATAAALPTAETEPDLTGEIGQLASMVEDGGWITSDPLGIGGLLTDAWRVDDLLRRGAISDEQLRKDLLSAANFSLRSYLAGDELRQPSEYRLAFRELGLAIGLQATETMWQTANDEATQSDESPELLSQLQALREYTSIGNDIESVWRNPEHRHSAAWSDHRDINEVMLATCLVPEGFLIKRALNP